jgi:glycosyltransferase involved in cell wall biosynthesis
MKAPSAPVYLIVPTRAVSGAEKRFMGLWVHLQQAGLSSVRLVTSVEAFREACTMAELGAIADFEDRVDTTALRGPMRFALAPLLFKLWARDPRSVFHFIMQPPSPVELPTTRRALLSICDAYLDHYSPRGMAQLYMGVTLARRVDMLDPPLFERFRDRFFFKRGAFSLTPNSFVDTTRYVPAPFAEKTNTINFTGRFIDEKQIGRLLDVLPEVDRWLKEAGVANPAYRLLGRGDDTVPPRCAALREKGIDVETWFETDPLRVLRTSKVFLSLQRSNNYPSKSLLEAMACGNVPVVTDVGTTERIAPRDLAEYVPRDFSGEDLARACLPALQMSEAAFEERVRNMRAFLDERFSLRTMAEYYLGIYRQLAREAS